MFQKSFLPTYSNVGTFSGPVDPSKLSSAAPSGQCKTLGEVLAAIPETSKWLDLMKSVGLENVLLNYNGAQKTLLVPVNSAFSAGINAQPLRPETTLEALIANAPDARLPLAGYSSTFSKG